VRYLGLKVRTVSLIIKSQRTQDNMTEEMLPLPAVQEDDFADWELLSMRLFLWFLSIEKRRRNEIVRKTHLGNLEFYKISFFHPTAIFTF
jgi:hypothetical protein